jgi:hypothetical protein
MASILSKEVVLMADNNLEDTDLAGEDLSVLKHRDIWNNVLKRFGVLFSKMAGSRTMLIVFMNYGYSLGLIYLLITKDLDPQVQWFMFWIFLTIIIFSSTIVGVITWSPIEVKASVGNK